MAATPLGIRVFGCLCESSNQYRKVTSYRAFILIATFLTYCSYHLSRKPISVVKSVLHINGTNASDCPDIANCSWPPFDNDNNYSELLGSLDYAFLFAYAIGMFFSGHIAERVNLRYFLTFGMVMCGVFTALFGMARYWNIHSFTYFLIIQIFAGVFQSTGWPSVVACTANWFGKGNRGLIMGIWNSHTSVGNILGTVIPAAFVQTNWGLSFIVPALIIFVMGILVFFFMVPHPNDVGLPDPNLKTPIVSNLVVSSYTRLARVEASDEEEEEEDSEANVNVEGPSSEEDSLLPKNKETRSPDEAISFRKALLIPGVIEFALCLFFAKLVSYTFLFWLPNYIKNTTTYGASKSADLSTAFDVGGIIGAITAGFISDRTGKSATTCMVMFLIAGPSLFIYERYGNTSLPVCILLLVISGAFVNGPYGLITTAVSADLGTHESLRGNSKALATVSAIIDGTGSMGAAIGPLLTGLISPTGWENVFWMLIAADALAFLLLLRLGSREILSYIQHRRDTNALRC